MRLLLALFALLVPLMAAAAPPIIIAHRGASGERPEHTIASYQLAIEQGADYIEPDLVLTKDGVLVARHENEISETTDVGSRAEFAAHRTTKVIDGETYNGWFTEDFTLAELKMLRARERLPQLRAANMVFDGQFAVPTFDEILALARDEGKKRGRVIGVYPETKHPSYFTSIGLPHEAALLGALKRFGHRGAKAPIFIQSFEVANLKSLRKKTRIRLIQLMDATGGPADQPGATYASMARPDGLAAIARYANGIGVSKAMVIPRGADGRLAEPTALVGDAHRARLAVHVWTFRRENYFLPKDFVLGDDLRSAGNLNAEIAAFLATGIDGLFSDNVAEAVAAVRR
jgi:glycerophosphoryl diester phosphodiesterase